MNEPSEKGLGGKPVFYFEVRERLEVSHVVGHDGQVARAGGRTDQDVLDPYRATGSFEVC